MKNNLIYPLIVGILIVVFEIYSGDKVELSYLLSDRIPTNLYDGNEAESIQQIELTNTGEVELSRIIIKIKAHVVDYSIQKVSNFDSISVTQDNNEFEIIYPKIPPTGVIKLVLKTKGPGFDNDNLNITHSKGTAINPLKENSIFTLSYILYVVLPAIYLALVIWEIRNLLIVNLRSNIFYAPYDLILTRTKPLFATLKEWKNIRHDATDYIFHKDNFNSISKSLAYRILNEDKPNYLSSDEWQKIKTNAEKELLKIVNGKINMDSHYEFKKVLKIKRPIHIDDEQWDRIVNAISNGYVVYAIRNLNLLEFYRDSERNLKRPDIVKDSVWQKYKFLVSKLNQIEKDKVLFESLIKEIHRVLLGNKLEEKPQEISDEYWTRLKFLEKKLQEYNSTEEELRQLKVLKSEVIPLKNKIEDQLRVINEVLSDPTAIDRIEEYSNTFSRGNFNNLKKISKLNKSIGND